MEVPSKENDECSKRILSKRFAKLVLSQKNVSEFCGGVCLESWSRSLQVVVATLEVSSESYHEMGNTLFTNM